MNYAMNDRCSCTRCTGEICECGCQTVAKQPSAAGSHCNCGTSCGCDAAEQGCLCGQ